MRWIWEETDPERSGSSGDLSKLFKNEAIKQPGIFAHEAPSPSATTLAREVIQNSWDAARELQDDMGDDSPPFEIEFRFRNLHDDQKRSLVATLALASLAARADHPDVDRKDLGLKQHDSLSTIDRWTSLPVLEITESGSSGMHGPFAGASSKLYLALISLGFTHKQVGAGGSYGYGKAGLIRGSGVRTVVAYTCFNERTDDPGVTRRLLGMTYWGQHRIDGRDYTGFARFGEPTESRSARPFENDQADEVARSLGLMLRSADDPSQLGTTFLLIEPTMTPTDLRDAIVRNWWPAILDREFTPIVIDESDQPLIPRPRADDKLKAFIRAYELAQMRQDNTVDEERRYPFNRDRLLTGTELEIGVLGLVADRAGWSYADTHSTPSSSEESSGSVDHKSLVALIRGPRMVVEYYVAGHQAPFVRGAFVAADGPIDELLRQTEPKAHDAWLTDVQSEGVDEAAPKAAKSITDRIRRNVNDFRRQLKPQVPKPDDVHLPTFERLFKDLLDEGSARIPPPLQERPVSISVRQEIEPEPTDPRSIVMRAEADISLSHHVSEPEAHVEVTISYKFLEDDRAGEECALVIGPPPGFSMVDGRFRGRLGHAPLAFSIESAPYSGEWTGRLVVGAELVEEGVRP